jgi:mannose-1-phosphate guanylyltransferase
MYAVILAGGGGTRLHPLSTPERPKPFLPLTGDRSLLQATIDRLHGVTDDITIVTDRKYEPLVREQTPGAQLLLEPMGRNTAAAIALAALMVDPKDKNDDVMLVLPADQTVADVPVFQGVLRHASEIARDGAFDIRSPLVTLGIQVDRPATEYGYLIPDVPRGGEVATLQAYPLRRFEEKPRPARAEELRDEEGVAWNAGIFVWRRPAILDALDQFTGLLQSLRPMLGSPVMLEHAYEAIQKPMSIDYAVMEGAASNGRVVMAGMNVGWSDIGSWTALLEGIHADGTGFVVQAGETIEVEDRDLVVRRRNGRVAVIPPPQTGTMTAAQTIAILRGVTAGDRDKVEALLERCSRVEARA